MTAYFTSASVAGRLPFGCLLCGPNKRKSLSPIQPTELLTSINDTAVRLWTTLPTVLISRPLTAISLDSLRNTWLVKRYATDADVKQAAIRLFLLCRDTSLRAKVRQIHIWYWWLRGSLVCTICYTCAVYTSMSEQRCRYNSVWYIYVIKILCTRVCWRNNVMWRWLIGRGLQRVR
jgi:hypothetical protein